MIRALCSSPHEQQFKSSPAEAVFSSPLVLPAEFPASLEDTQKFLIPSYLKWATSQRQSLSPSSNLRAHLPPKVYLKVGNNEK